MYLEKPVLYQKIKGLISEIESSSNSSISDEQKKALQQASVELNKSLDSFDRNIPNFIIVGYDLLAVNCGFTIIFALAKSYLVTYANLQKSIQIPYLSEQFKNIEQLSIAIFYHSHPRHISYVDFPVNLLREKLEKIFQAELPECVESDYQKFSRNLMCQENMDEFKKAFDHFFDKKATRMLVHPHPPIKTINNLLEGNFIVGESHSHRAPKKFLIENMQRFKEAGFTTLFMEHLFYEDQDQLDEKNMGEEMQRHLDKLDAGHMSYRPQAKGLYCFTTLVNAAKAVGIRVVALDCRESYKEQKKSHADSYRMRSMNYTAYQIISEETKNNSGKWFALIGSGHVKDYCGAIGLSDLTGARSVFILDKNKKKGLNSIFFKLSKAAVIRYNSPFALEDLSCNADVYIKCDPMMGTPRLTPIENTSLIQMPLH